MLKYVLKRILSALVTIFFIITITFFLMKAIPGNPFAAEKMPNPEIEAAMMAKYGLDQPLWKQYIIYLGNFLRGDFGVSYTKAGLTVNKVIADGFPFSLTIGIYASLVVVFAGILFGSVCALRQNKLIDRFFMVLSTLGSTIPSFVLATGFLFLFSKTLGLVPAFGVDEVAGYIPTVLHHPPDPHQPGGGAAAGLHPHCPEQGHLRIQGNLQARPAQCPAAGGDLHRAHGGLHCHRLLCH